MSEIRLWEDPIILSAIATPSLAMSLYAYLNIGVLEAQIIGVPAAVAAALIIPNTIRGCAIVGRAAYSDIKGLFSTASGGTLTEEDDP